MVFILIIIGIFLILLNIKAIKKEDNSFSSILKREESITSRDYDVEIISIRKDLAESILDIQKEMEEIKNSIININNKDGDKINYLEDIEEKVRKDDSIINDIKSIEGDNVMSSIKSNGEDVISEINFANTNNESNKTNKVDEVKRLVENGLTDEEICEKMAIGKGEVLLIRGLFKNLKI